MACRIIIPASKTEKASIKQRFTHLLDSICSVPQEFAKAETLRKRLLPGAREHSEVFAFIDFDAPPTNNHAERALRPLVIARKISMGTRSPTGSENTTIFASLVQTAKLQEAPVLPIMQALLAGTATETQTALFNNSG